MTDPDIDAIAARMREAALLCIDMDSLSHGAWPEEVLQRRCALNDVAVPGNVLAILADRERLQALVAEARVFLTHRSAQEDIDDWLARTAPKKENDDNG